LVFFYASLLTRAPWITSRTWLITICDLSNPLVVTGGVASPGLAGYPNIA